MTIGREYLDKGATFGHLILLHILEPLLPIVELVLPNTNGTGISPYILSALLPIGIDLAELFNVHVFHIALR